jgi:hypothetical protein
MDALQAEATAASYALSFAYEAGMAEGFFTRKNRQAVGDCFYGFGIYGDFLCAASFKYIYDSIKIKLCSVSRYVGGLVPLPFIVVFACLAFDFRLISCCQAYTLVFIHLNRAGA